MTLPSGVRKWLRVQELEEKDLVIEQGTLKDLTDFLGIKERDNKKIKDDFDPPYQKYQKAVVYLVEREPFYAHLLGDCIMEWDKKGVPTMGVLFQNGTFHLAVNSEFVDELSVYQVAGVIKHEMLHIIFNHPARAKNFIHVPYNISADIAINQMINTSHKLADIDVLLPENVDFKWPKALSAEDYYTKLVETKKEFVPCPQCDGDKTVTPDGNETPNELVYSLAGERKKKCPTCTGQGSQKKSNDGSHNRFYAPSGRELVRIIDYDGHGTWEISDKGEGQGQEGKGAGEGKDGEPESCDSEEVQANKTRQMVQKAFERSKNSGNIFAPGTMPGWAESLIRELLDSTIPWQQILRSFVHRASISIIRQTRNRPNRRFGNIYPGNVSDYKLKMVIPVDVSGSMSDEDIALIFDEVDKIKTDRHEVYVMEHDTRVVNFYKYTKRPKTVGGRGGTSFQPVLDYLKEKNIKPDCIIWCTDGDSCDVPTKPTYPVLWLYTPMYNRRVDWGKFIAIKPNKKSRQKAA